MPKESNVQRNYQNEILAHQNFNEFLPKSETSATLPKKHKRQNADESFALISISI